LARSDWGMAGRALLAAAVALGLSGCAAHEIYESIGPIPATADEDWANCQAKALAAVGERTDVDGLRGKTSVSGRRLVGTVATLDVGGGTMYSPSDYLKITTRRDVLRACMRERGYKFIGVPAVEAL